MHLRGDRGFHRGADHDLRNLGRVPVLPGGRQDRTGRAGGEGQSQDLPAGRKVQIDAGNASQCLGRSRQFRDAAGSCLLGTPEQGDPGRTARRVGSDDAGPFRFDRDREGQALCGGGEDEGHPDRRSEHRSRDGARCRSTSGAATPSSVRTARAPGDVWSSAATVPVAIWRVQSRRRDLRLHARHRRHAGRWMADGPIV